MNLSKEEIVRLLVTEDEKERSSLIAEAYRTKVSRRGDKVYLRGLIELSNRCRKDCLYCGIRSSNKAVERYELDDGAVVSEAMFAFRAGYGSVVIQSGERNDRAFTSRITRLVRKIKELSDGRLGITLSCGEQSYDIYKEWREAGAHRYLLRIESSTKSLYEKIHPADSRHSFEYRLGCLGFLRDAGYKVGTGVMIGLPFQTPENLADDLLFFKRIGVDMIGMGPYLEHRQTPLYAYKDMLLPKSRRLELTIRMIALLRILMPDINIAATTALQVIDPMGREKAVMAGANVIMPNMTDSSKRGNYQIYENKPGVGEDAEITKSNLESNLAACGIGIGWNEWGDFDTAGVPTGRECRVPGQDGNA